MPVKFYTPRLVIRNITHNKAVAIFDEYRIQPGEQIDIFDVFDPLDLEEDRILKALEKPWGDLYQEVVVKQTLEIVALDLPSFHYNVVAPADLNSVNTPGPGQLPAYLDDERFQWVSAAGIAVSPPLVLTGNLISMPPANGSQDGYLTKEDYAAFMAGIKRQQKIWQYQDFGSPVSTSLTLSAFQNGTGLTFNSSYIVPNTATIVLTSDNSKPPTTTVSIPGRWLPGNRVEVSSHTGTTVILDQLPESTLNCRVWYLVSLPASIPAPIDYVEAPQFVAQGNLDTLDDLYLNQEGNETVYGIKTFENRPIFNDSIRIPPGAVDGYVLTSDGFGNGSWKPSTATIDNTDVFTVGAARAHAKASNIYLRTYDGATTLTSPFVIPFNCTLIAMSASSETAASWSAEVHVGQSLVAGAALSISATDTAYAAKNIPFLAGTRIQFFCNGSNIPFPRINLFFLRDKP